MKNQCMVNYLVFRVAMLFLAVSLSSCVGRPGILPENLALTKKISIISVTMPKVADISRETNRQVLQASLNYARERIAADLQHVRSWKIVEPSGAKPAKMLRAFGAVSDDELRSRFPQGEGPVLARKAFDLERTRWKEQHVGAEHLPVVPRSALVADQGNGRGDLQIRPFLLDQAGKLCAALGVDAVMLLYIDAAITHPRANAFIVKENRTDGMLQMALSLVMVDRAGQIIADLGQPALDDRAASRDLLPLYLGTGRDAVKPGNIDLGDPRKKVAQAFRSMIDETSSDMAIQFKGAAGN